MGNGQTLAEHTLAQVRAKAVKTVQWVEQTGDRGRNRVLVDATGVQPRELALPGGRLVPIEVRDEYAVAAAAVDGLVIEPDECGSSIKWVVVWDGQKLVVQQDRQDG